MIETLRSTLDRHAAQVAPRPDPYARVLLRRRRRRTRRVSAAALLAVLLVVAPATWLSRQPDPARPVAGHPPVALLPLLDSPTRGSLAGKPAYLLALRERAAGEDDMWREHPAGAPRLPRDPEQIKVLFAGDIGSRRIAVVAGLDSRPLYAVYQGAVGDDAAELRYSASGQLEPVLATDFASGGDDPSQTYLLLGPLGAVYEKAELSFTSAGVQRTWTPLPEPGDYAAFADLRGRHEFRVLLAGKVLLETSGGHAIPLEGGRRPAVDPQPAGGRGEPFPDAAAQVAQALSNSTGLALPEVTFRVLWSEEIDRPGTTTGRAYVVTVQAVLADGSGPFLTGAVDTGDGSFRDHPTGYGIAGDVAHTLIVMRLPHYAESPGDRLQLVAPPLAVRAEVSNGRQTHQVTLVDGVGHLDVPPGMTVTVRAYDAANALLAEKQYVDLDGFGCNRFDPWSCASPPPTRAPAPSR
ncbi:hypothetical protein [Catellatospora sp. NPDC049609]|uniref:hypothetical protein n=1 Tax=Catellatospora sp. NPDC049609 TaxID=3155505 RepID=UPI00341F08A7